MANLLQQYAQFITFIIRHGHLVPTGEDFNQIRSETLKEFLEFIPPGKKVMIPHSSRKGVIKNMIGQMAYFQKSFRPRGAHLTFKTLSYIRIPKSGSTSISLEMLRHVYPALKERVLTEKQINFLTDANLETENPGATIFTIARNPFSRLVSVYRDFFEKQSSFIYADYLFGIFAKDISFSEFVHRLALIPDRLKDQHIRPQHLFFQFYERKGLTVRIFHLEKQDKLNNFLAGNSLQLHHLNKSADEYDYRLYYTVETLEKVRSVYATDVVRFGYENDYHELKVYLKTVQK